MTNLLLSEGGYPLHLDDLETLQTEAQVLAKIMTSWCKSCLLQGCYVYQEDEYIRYTEGLISDEEHIYTCQAGTISNDQAKGEAYWILSRQEEGQRVYEDGQERPTRVIHTARLIYSERTPSEKHIKMADMPRLGVHIAQSGRRLSYESTNNLVSVLSVQEVGANNALMTLCLKTGNHKVSEPIEGIKKVGAASVVGDATLSGGGLPSDRHYHLYVNGSTLQIVPLGVQDVRGAVITLSSDIYVTLPLYLSYDSTISNDVPDDKILPPSAFERPRRDYDRSRTRK